jgi:hypothetical protein
MRVSPDGLHSFKSEFGLQNQSATKHIPQGRALRRLEGEERRWLAQRVCGLQRLDVGEDNAVFGTFMKSSARIK